MIKLKDLLSEKYYRNKNDFGRQKYWTVTQSFTAETYTGKYKGTGQHYGGFGRGTSELQKAITKKLNVKKGMELQALPGGLFIMSCAGLARPEHGTSRSHPVAMPFTQEMDRWKDFYRNRTPYDFKMIPHWDRLCNGYWGINEETSDLYYRGFKKNKK